MAEAVNVKWPGQQIADDSAHRLVTDAQIERWNKINRISDEEQYIELTPENISQYTCTKADEYWTDMGLADGTIFDSSSLDEGNYIIKLGMDKLIKDSTSTRSPMFRFDKESLSYQTYVKYTIETNTFLFLCMFFNVELSLSDLLTNFTNYYGCNIILQTELIDSESFASKIIKWPEDIRIKITKEQYGPENNMYVLKRNIFFDMNIIDYYNCYNYKWVADETNESGGIWESCDFTGVPVRTVSTGNSAVPYYSSILSSKTAREYILQSQKLTTWYKDVSYPPNIYNAFDSIHVSPNYTASFYGTEENNETIISNVGIAVIDANSGYSISSPFASIYYSNDYPGTYITNDSINLAYYDNESRYSLKLTPEDISLYIGRQSDHNKKVYISNKNIMLELFDNSVLLHYSIYSDGVNISFNNYGVDDAPSSSSFGFTLYGFSGNLYHPLKLKINDTTTYSYDNTEDVTVDLSKLSQTSVITDWDSVTSNGEYSSAAGATNAPTSDIAYMGSVVRGATSITQKLYADTDDLTAVSEYIRRGKITKDADNNETITWGDWYCIDYSVPTTASSQE